MVKWIYQAEKAGKSIFIESILSLEWKAVIMRYKQIYKLVNKNGRYPSILFTPHIRALNDSTYPEPFMRARLIAVSEVNFENRISFVFDFNGYEEFNKTISDKTFPGNVCTVTVSLFSHFGDNAIDFFQIIEEPSSYSGKSLNEQLKQLVTIAEMFELHDAANYLKTIIK